MKKIMLSTVLLLLCPHAQAAGDAKAGAKVYAGNCAACHGPKAEGNTALKAPSLKDAGTWKPALFKRALKELKDDKGVALKAPMMKFPALNDKQVADIQAFVKTSAKK